MIGDIGPLGMDVVELIRRARRSPELRYLPITAGDRGREALGAGCCMVFQKPFSNEQLRSAVQSLLSE